MLFAASAPPLLAELAILVFGGAVLAYVLQRVGIVPIVGFLLAGVLIGPSGFAFVEDRELIDQTAEIGVILLLFTIGLELSLGELRRMGALMFGGGGLQVGLTTAIVTGALAAAGVDWKIGIYTGFLVALSSTAIVLKLLADRGETNSPSGQIGLSFLIFQDLAIVAMVLIVPMLGDGGGGLGDIAWALGRALLLVVLVLVVARRILPVCLEAVARTCSSEVFLLTVVAVALGTAWLSSLFDVSVSLGAFLAGLVISESRYKDQALGEVLPLQTLFSATFFVSVGMLLDLSFLADEWLLVVGAVFAVLGIKIVGTAVAAAVFRRPLPVIAASALLLAQIGEFSFVLESAGRDAGLTPADLGEDGSQTFIATTVVLMTLTPFLAQGGRWLGRRLEDRSEQPVVEAHEDLPEPEPVELSNHVVIAGYGRHASILAHALELAQLPFVITTLNPSAADHGDRRGRQVVFADASRQRTLELVGLPQARVLVVADDDPQTVERIVSVAKTLAPDVPVMVRTRYEADATDIGEPVNGVYAVSEQSAADDSMATHLLFKYGIAEDQVSRFVRAAIVDGQDVPVAAADTDRQPDAIVDPEHPIRVSVPDGCEHAPRDVTVWPSAPGCEECLRDGTRWVHLRICTVCGHVGCCDSSPHRHASAHFHETGHPVMRSVEPGEHWAWCFVDERIMDTVTPVDDPGHH